MHESDAGANELVVGYELRSGIAWITLTRPEKLNALDHQMLEALRHSFERATRDEEVRGIILTGSGTRAFVAGADISEFVRLSQLEACVMSRRGQALFREVELSRKPVIAAINGVALGGGCELALACHLRIAARTARFGLPEVRLGLIPGYGGTVRLSRLIGKGRALEMILTGEAVDAEEAHRIGLVNRVVEPEALREEAEALLRRVLANAPLALAAAIEGVTQGAEMGMEPALALEAQLFGNLAATDDMREGVTAFLEKRPAEFRGH
jgi:enoyl-CoA hydratase